MAAPLGPPPVSATTSTDPSGHTRLRLRRLISTHSTLPSGSATGPSGNCSPSATTRTSSTRKSPLGSLPRSATDATLSGVNYYDVLGAPQEADQDELHRAFQRRLQLVPPDRHVGSSREVLAEAHRMTAALTEAW